MKFYNIDMQGKLIVQRDTALPSVSASNEGRLFYDETGEDLYYQTGSVWSKVWSESNSDPGFTNWEENGTDLRPKVDGYAFGDLTHAIGNIYQGNDKYHYFGDGAYGQAYIIYDSDDPLPGDMIIMNTEAGEIQLGTDDTVAITIDGSQNATFTGDIITGTVNRLYMGGSSNSVINHDGGNFYVYANVGELRLGSGGSPALAFSTSQVATFTNFPITPSSAPTTDYQVANKKYVDDNAGLANWEESGTALRPKVAGYNLGDTTHELGNIYQGQSQNHYWGNSQEGYIYHSSGGFAIVNTSGTLNIVNSGEPNTYIDHNGAVGNTQIRMTGTNQVAVDIDSNLDVTFGGDVYHGTAKKAYFGTGPGAEIYHSTDMYIRAITGSMDFRTGGTEGTTALKINTSQAVAFGASGYFSIFHSSGAYLQNTSGDTYINNTTASSIKLSTNGTQGLEVDQYGFLHMLRDERMKIRYDSGNTTYQTNIVMISSGSFYSGLYFIRIGNTPGINALLYINLETSTITVLAGSTQLVASSTPLASQVGVFISGSLYIRDNNGPAGATWELLSAAMFNTAT